jgi:hypothetical protein
MLFSSRILFAVAFAIVGTSAHAHKPSDSYLTLKVDGGNVNGQWDIALRDLDFAIGLDTNLDGSVEWGEVKAKHEEIAAYALARLKLEMDGAACVSKATDHKATTHSDGGYAVLYFVAVCPKAGAALQAKYSLFFDLDQQHKGLLNLQFEGQTRTGIFSVSDGTQRFQLAKPSKWRQFTEYLVEGVWHIWQGFDHILFLLSLLLPAVLILRGQVWEAATSFRAAFWEVLKVVTAFTAAHSITLTLATLGVLSIPSRLSESAIAASVLVAALNNVFPIVYGRRWMVAFFFGLIHGFGFANVLTDLGLPRDTLLLALVAFNLGVEVGQVAIVAVFLPLAFALRRTWFYRKVTLVAGSVAIALLAAVWLAERAFDLKILPTRT